MAQHNGYIIVEGPHDVEAIGRLLRPFQFHTIENLQNLDPFWQASNLIPSTFPHKGNLLKRVPVPTFFQTETHSIAIHSVGGDSNIANEIEGTLTKMPHADNLHSIGIFLDADANLNVPVATRFQNLLAGLNNPDLRAVTQSLNFTWPDNPGDVVAGPPSAGIFVVPDNRTQGTLEDLLIDAAQVQYPHLASAAGQYVQNVQDNPNNGLTNQDLAEIRRPAGVKKAQIASMASILKPGKSIQVSIKDNRWLEGGALNLPNIQAVTDFLRQLLQL